jgi:RNA recognition motif-containing protein
LTEGKPAGYGFCEYRDAATAQSAIRNINNENYRNKRLLVTLDGGTIFFPQMACNENLIDRGTKWTKCCF